MTTQEENSKHVLVFCEGLPIGKQIKIKRCHDSLSLRDLQAIIKVPRTVLSEIECNRRSIPLKHKKAINDYLYHMYFDDGELMERWEQ